MGNVTNDVWNQLNMLYTLVDRLKNTIGLEYTENDEYVCYNTDQVDADWCDEELLADIDNLHADLGYFLGK